MNIEVVRDQSVNEFLENAGSLLYRDEATNSLMLGLCSNILNSKEPPKTAPLFLRILKGGHTVSAAIQTPPMNLVITFAKNDELKFLADYLLTSKIAFPGVVGPAVESEKFANIWSEVAGKNAKLAMGQRIYKIEEVKIPNSNGYFRPARASEVELVTQWLVEFGNESLPESERKSFAERLPQAARIIASELVYVWTIDDLPVSMAQIGRPTKNGISVYGVYTPKDQRRKGFASAVVAQLSQKMLNEGKKFCTLYTDLSNPTSNKIYQDIGYKEVSDSKHFIFEDKLST